MRMRTTAAAMTVLGLALVGCNSSAEADIASDACDLMGEMMEGGPEALMTGMEDFQELEQRAQEADIADEDMEQAMRDQCPDVFNDLDGMLEPE